MGIRRLTSQFLGLLMVLFLLETLIFYSYFPPFFNSNNDDEGREKIPGELEKNQQVVHAKEFVEKGNPALDDDPEQKEVQHKTEGTYQDIQQPEDEANLHYSRVSQLQWPELQNFDWAPNYFYLTESNLEPALRIKNRESHCQSSNQTIRKGRENRCCEVVYFIGSYKCGSTTLAIQLKHKVNSTDEHDPHSGFINAGKEPCFAMKSSSVDPVGCKCSKDSSGGGKKTFLLDACPYYIEGHANRIYCSNPNARLVMLLRDPYDRVLSQYNSDVRRRGLKTPADKFVSSPKNLSFSNYYKILKGFLQYFNTSQILLVKTEALTDDPQSTVDAVRKHFGMETRKINAFWGNKGQGTVGYLDPNKKIHETTLKQITAWNLDFFRLIGFKFDWKMYINAES